MAKTPRTGGENRGRRVADRRRPAQPEAAGPESATGATADDRHVAAGTGTRRVPTHDDIARRAYEIFTARGGTHGYHIEDWLRAEHELRGK